MHTGNRNYSYSTKELRRENGSRMSCAVGIYTEVSRSTTALRVCHKVPIVPIATAAGGPGREKSPMTHLSTARKHETTVKNPLQEYQSSVYSYS